MTNILAQLQTLVSELKSTTSNNDKVDILKKHLSDNAELQKLMMYIHNPFYQFYVSSDVLKKRKDLWANTIPENIFKLLDLLRTRNITGHDAIAAVNSFVTENKFYEELIHNIIDKDLQTRAGDKLINKAVANLIPEFSCALGHAFEGQDLDFDNQKYLISRKLDGCRVLLVVDEEGTATCFSRNGKTYETLSVLEEEAKKIGLKNVVYDGEVCIVDENGKEDFSSMMSLIRRKDFTIPNPKLFIFDFLTTEEFNSQKSKRILSDRQKDLKETLKSYKGSIFQILPQYPATDESFADLQQQSRDGGWEGLIIRLDEKYKGKRSNDILKVKEFQDAEYKVKRIASGPFRIVENGKEITEEIMTNVYIEHKGEEVSVGSGFSIDQRREIHKDPRKIIGKIITVQYFQESVDKTGKLSLRFPTCKVIHGDKREV